VEMMRSRKQRRHYRGMHPSKHKRLANLMDCKTVDKFDSGEHQFEPIQRHPATKSLTANAVLLYLDCGGKIVHEDACHRYVVFHGQKVGSCTNGILETVKQFRPLVGRQIPGTYQVEYCLQK